MFPFVPLAHPRPRPVHPDDPSVVLYHGGHCLDGFASAYIAWKALGERAHYLPMVHHRPFPEDLDVHGQRLLFVDFAPPWTTLLRLRDRAQHVRVLDHHQGALDDYRAIGAPALHHACFDTSVSGCVLAWRAFYPEVPLPSLLAWIADKDLYRFEHPESARFCRRLEQEVQTFEHWDALLTLLDQDDDARDRFLADGAVLLAADDLLVDHLVAQAMPIVVEGHRGLAVNAPSGIFHRVCHVLAQRSGTFGMAFRVSLDDQGVLHAGGVLCSEMGVFDVLPLAKALGGNGHPSSAGFGVPVATLEGLLQAGREVGP